MTTSITTSRPRSVADLAGGIILATVEIGAPPERVFRALASEDVTLWWGQEGVYTTTAWTGDVRVGGCFRAGGVGADGKPFAVVGEYLEVEPPHRLAHTWRPDWDDQETTKVTYSLDAIEGGTRVTVRHEGFASRASCRAHGDGWAMVLGWLSGYAARPAPAADKVPFLVRLIPPRPSFAMDMSDDERAMMNQHVAYWSKLLADGVAVAFGPVLDPKGPWGVGLVQVAAPEDMKAIEARDPAIMGGRGLRYEVLPVMRLVARPHVAP